MLGCPKASPTELDPSTEPTCAELPRLAAREELILKELMPLTGLEHAAQPQEVPVDAPARGRSAREAVVRLQRGA